MIIRKSSFVELVPLYVLNNKNTNAGRHNMGRNVVQVLQQQHPRRILYLNTNDI